MIQISHETDVLLLDDDTHLRTALSQTFDLAGLREAAAALKVLRKLCQHNGQVS